MRLFTAIELTDEARAGVDAERKEIASKLSGFRSLRFVRSEHLHLTLVFIGDVPDARVTPIVETMSVEIRQPPFRLVFGGLGVFPSHGAPRVLWLGVVGGAQQALDLHAQVAERLAGAGVAVEQKPFHPHLTLARWRDRRRSSRPALDATPGVVAALDVSAVALVQSQLSSTGPTYTRLSQARLIWR